MPGSFIQFGQDLNRTEITHRDFNARRMWGGGSDPCIVWDKSGEPTNHLDISLPKELNIYHKL